MDAVGEVKKSLFWVVQFSNKALKLLGSFITRRLLPSFRLDRTRSRSSQGKALGIYGAVPLARRSLHSDAVLLPSVLYFLF